jgi:Domain of unknown function (DUF6391)
MVSRLLRSLPSLMLDALVVVALVFPQACTYLRWPFLAAYAVLTYAVLKNLSENRWVFTIVRDSRTRIAHGLEHATIAVLGESGAPVVRGFTHGRNCFVVVLEAGNSDRKAAVEQAAAWAIRRIRRGERALAYHPGCGTSEVVAAVSLWLLCVSSVVLSLALDGSMAVFFAIGVLAFRLWLTGSTALGLLTQRWFTVSTAFTTASVIRVSDTSCALGHARPDDETWFEVTVEFAIAAKEGGVVAPI